MRLLRQSFEEGNARGTVKYRGSIDVFPLPVREVGLNQRQPTTRQVVCGAHGSACAPPLALPDTGALPITSESRRSASLTPSPVAPEIRRGVLLAARFKRSLCVFSSPGVTASILFSATISIFSARCPS